ncbi:MAG: hypothetical protein COA88_13320 [Kordia sp.]|nr:MAG: hypothetical protein COA88_13320 [Kordia sp.]
MEMKLKKLEGTIEDIWSIRICHGKSPLEIDISKNAHIAEITKDDVTDIPALFVADPFMIHDEKKWYLFMGILNSETELGEIGLVTSTNGTTWEYQQVVLKEDYHLSYPFIFKHDDEFYMIPETLDTQAVHLYKASNFPYDWGISNRYCKRKICRSNCFSPS